MKAVDVINALGLEPLTIEGGYFAETYRSTSPAAMNNRCCGTSIYYLLDGIGKSDWHCVASDEIWFYHAGVSAIQLLLFADSHWEERRIGADLTAGESPQSLIPAGTWQAAVLQSRHPNAWGLFGATVFPGFEYADFTAGAGEDMCRRYPTAAARIHELNLV